VPHAIYLEKPRQNLYCPRNCHWSWWHLEFISISWNSIGLWHVYFGYSFKTWEDKKSFADGATILKYINEAADEYKVRDHIVYQQKAVTFNFDSQAKLWCSCKPLLMKRQFTNLSFGCSGYYNYIKGYQQFKDQNLFNGSIIHPQHWPKSGCSR
jgi:cation diffusion facilitator CzcD-associated flavoprotein CzcO